MIIKKTVKYLFKGILIVVCCVLFIVVTFRILSYFRESQEYTRAAPLSGRFVETNKGDIYIQEVGEPNNQAVLFIHGTGAWSGTWKDTMQAVSEAGFYTIAIDLPPFGYSEKPDTSSYSREEQAQRIVSVLDGLHIKDAIVVGHSYGGGATVETVLQFPEKISKLILVDVALGLENPKTKPTLVSSLLKIRIVREAFLSTTVTNPLFTRTLLKLFIADPRNATDAWVKLYQQPMNVKGGTRAVGEWLPTLISPSDTGLSTDSNQYKNISVPTAILWGEKDTITPLSQGNYISKIIPTSTLIVLPDIGHIPQIENPQSFQKILIEYLTTN